MADSNVVITAGSGTNIDTRTESTNSHHRQVVVLGDPLINANVAAVASQDVASSDQTTPASLVRVAGSATVVGLQGTTARPFIMNTDGAIKIYDIVNGTVSITGTITGITNTVGVKFDGSSPAVSVEAKYGATKVPLLGNTDGAIKVYDIVTGTINTVANVTNITNSIAVHLLSTNGTLGVNIGTIANTAAIMAKDGSFAVYFSPSNPKVSLSTDVLNTSQTASVASAGGTVAGSTSGVSVSGVTLVSPEASRNIKVYAFSLTTTAQVHNQVRFTDGAGTSPTTFWQVALQAPSAGIAGANLAVTPPGYLFSMGSNTTLALVKDTASLVHYSIAYFKESA